MAFTGAEVYARDVARGRRKKDEETTSGTAPSAADLDALNKMEASEEAQHHEPSDTDAMGQDKRREVIGHSYGPSKKTQLVFFIAVAAVFAILIGGYLAAIAAFDQPEDTYADEAPWSKEGAPTQKPLDPATPCGEPGNPQPDDSSVEDSPCAAKAGIAPTGSSSGAGQEDGAGGVTDASGESSSDAQ